MPLTPAALPRSPRRALLLRCVAAAIAVLAVLVAPLLMPGTALASSGATVRLSSYDTALLHDINDARRAHGVRALVASAGTTDVAHRWSCAMRKATVLSHRPNLVLALQRHGSNTWHTLGENVGMSSSSAPGALFSAYMHSPEHRANILDPAYRFIGVHTERARGISWNTLDFVDAYSTSYGSTRATC